MSQPKECPTCKGTDLHRTRPYWLGENTIIVVEAECENCNACWSEFYAFDHLDNIHNP